MADHLIRYRGGLGSGDIRYVSAGGKPVKTRIYLNNYPLGQLTRNASDRFLAAE